MKAKMDAFESELSKIAGLKGLKSQLRSWAKQLMMDERRRALGLKVGNRRPPHMAFLGNPGTGKTMVARLLGKLLHILDILPTDKVVEVQRTDLVAEYLGQTGHRTRDKIQEAEGGILFVDEAYRLMPPDLHYRDYGLEALEEIMSFMDGGKVVVIFAGYSHQMQRVISANEGFRRRVTKLFRFDDFTCKDLAKILRLKMSNNDQDSPLYGFKLHPSCTVPCIAESIRQGSTEKQCNEMNGGLVDVMLVNARENLDKRIDVEWGHWYFDYDHVRGFESRASVDETV
ncbi:protein cfxq homolog [Phtheirospermum japonicum]|uniref:Protein cfxq homolog n=1 Tax=Phtheirospermum japonicum TaxID=374723 RepID=A0A830B9Z0_9LAMI|nr:protein cfxq homolog [Phtheirospermum japonicum]